jgi:hypothetical protein
MLIVTPQVSFPSNSLYIQISLYPLDLQIMKYQFLLIPLISFLLLSSCKSPTKLLEEGKYKSAFRKAVGEDKQGKNVEENIKVNEAAAEIKVNEALTFTAIKTRSENVKDWIETQTKVYKLLEDLGKANILTQGSISEPYDALCNEKKEIDYQIVDFYYEEGHNHLDRFYNEGNKIDARHAFYSLKNCEKYEGQQFFLNLLENTQDAHQNGIVYYVSNYGRIAKKLFLQQLPKDADFLPDCDINIDHGYVSFDKSESSSSKDYSKKVEDGKEEITDTSGHVTYKTIEATVTTNTVTVTTIVTTFINCKNVIGQCSVSSSQYTTEVSDTYEEVSIEGDEDALDHHVDTNDGEPAFFESGLESEVLKLADRNVGI